MSTDRHELAQNIANLLIPLVASSTSKDGFTNEISDLSQNKTDIEIAKIRLGGSIETLLLNPDIFQQLSQVFQTLEPKDSGTTITARDYGIAGGGDLIGTFIAGNNNRVGASTVSTMDVVRKKLHDKLHEAGIPDDQAEALENAAGDLAQNMEKLGSTSPEVKEKANSLKRAAENIKAVLPNVLDIAWSIILSALRFKTMGL